MGWQDRGTAKRSSGFDGHLERHLLGDLLSILRARGFQQIARTNDLFYKRRGGKHRCLYSVGTKNRSYWGHIGYHYRLCGLCSGTPMDRSGTRSQKRAFGPAI